MEEHQQKRRLQHLLQVDLKKLDTLASETLLTNAIFAFYGEATYQNLDMAAAFYQRYMTLENQTDDDFEQLVKDMEDIKAIRELYAQNQFAQVVAYEPKLAERSYAEVFEMFGKSYIRLQNNTKSLECMLKAFQHGVQDADVFLNVGYLYQEGKMVEQDMAKAVELYKIAASLGSSVAMHNLGGLYHSNEAGDLVQKEEAIAYLKQAVKQGFFQSAALLKEIQPDESSSSLGQVSILSSPVTVKQEPIDNTLSALAADFL